MMYGSRAHGLSHDEQARTVWQQKLLRHHHRALLMHSSSGPPLHEPSISIDTPINNPIDTSIALTTGLPPTSEIENHSPLRLVATHVLVHNGSRKRVHAIMAEHELPHPSAFTLMMKAAHHKTNSDISHKRCPSTSRRYPSSLKVPSYNPLTASSYTRKTNSAALPLGIRAGEAKQSFLDFGQNLLGLTQCDKCNTLYQRGNALDESAHGEQHDRFLRGLPFDGWKNEPRVHIKHGLSNIDDRILCIRREEVKARKKNVQSWLELLYTELGSNLNSSMQRAETTTLLPDQALYVYISSKRVVGLLCATSNLNEIHRIDPCRDRLQLNESTTADTDEYTKQAVVGIERIWVLPSCRRRGIATHLLTAAMQFFPGIQLTKEQLAFCQPTRDGRLLAQSFTGQSSFWAYA